ncbi:MAG: hypothetical protein N2C14_17770 [Planctomycetales bacterium]
MPQEHDDRLSIPRAPCRHLLSKGMFVTGTLNPEEDDYEEIGDGHCWCALTQDPMGPDRLIVERSECREGRSCFEPRV